MGRRKIPDNELTAEQLKRRKRNERYRKKTVSNSSTLRLVQDEPAFKYRPSQTKSSASKKETVDCLSQSLKNVDKNETQNGFTDTRPLHKEAALNQIQLDNLPENLLDNPISWGELLATTIRPSSVLIVLCISFLTVYLVYQGVVFFSAIDPVPISAISSAVVSEIIPFLCAACFALATKNSHRLIAFAMLMLTIVGLGFFMHSSLSTQLTRGSGRYERLVESRKLTMATIATHSSALDNLPETYITKRQSLAEKIGLERENLDRIDREIDSLESYGSGFHNTGLGYAVWIRIAAMLLNAYLIHLFFSGFRRKNEMPA